LILPELTDPRCGEFELRPYGEFLSWRIENGPDVPIPGETITERESLAGFARAFDTLLGRSERTILAILHGFCIGWMLRAVSRSKEIDAAFAEPHRLSRRQIVDALEEIRDDLYRYFSVP
jgi:hypothetical protein